MAFLSGPRATPGIATLFFAIANTGRNDRHAEGEEMRVCAPQAFGPSGAPSFLARWRLLSRPTSEDARGIRSVGDGSEEIAALFSLLLACFEHNGDRCALGSLFSV